LWKLTAAIYTYEVEIQYLRFNIKRINTKHTKRGGRKRKEG